MRGVMTSAEMQGRVSLTFDDSGNGPTLRMDMPNLEAVRALMNVFQGLGEGRVFNASLTQADFVARGNVSRFTLIAQSGERQRGSPKALRVLRGHAGSAALVWAQPCAAWLDCRDLLASFGKGPGHQYLTFRRVDDALIEACFQEHTPSPNADNGEARRADGRSAVLAVAPTYNERENLPVLAEQVRALPSPVHLLVVDDHSPDGTGELAESLLSRGQPMSVIHRPRRAGLALALREGYSWALTHRFEYIVSLDADLSHAPEDIPALVEAASVADLAVGSRHIGIRIIDWAPHPLMVRLLIAKCVRLITGMPFHDPTCGFQCFHRRLLERVLRAPLHSAGYGFHVELLHRAWRAGAKITEAPILFTDRQRGQSKMSCRHAFEAVWVAWRLLLQNGFRRQPAATPLSAEA